jgi:hypothetical protein
LESIITFDEYNILKELSEFGCPKNRDHRDCWLDNDCRKRPNPCIECPSTREVDWARETCDKKIIEDVWSKHVKNCSNCTLWIDYEEEQTYRETCERMKHAKLTLHLISKGKITIFRDPNKGWEIPL